MKNNIFIFTIYQKQGKSQLHSFVSSLKIASDSQSSEVLYPKAWLRSINGTGTSLCKRPSNDKKNIVEK
jgi:hypothetical protein